MELTYEQQLEFARLKDYYDRLDRFMRENKRINYIEFDYSVVHKLTLFTIDPDFSFTILEDEINKILKTLPAIKQIFAKPFIHLKEQNIILPTEAVRIVDNNTLQHISSHSELWTDINENGIKPAKLLTRTYEDNYGIYENIVFCKTIDEIIAFCKSRLRILQELIYTNQTIEINLLERVNHLNYFLALGKLHTGYSRQFDSYYGEASQCLNKIELLLNTIVPRLKRPVYKKNKIKPKAIKVHKTNILSMHRDYHQIYKLAKYFSSHHYDNERLITEDDILALKKNYFDYTMILIIFSIGHFNFECDKESAITFSRLNMEFSYKKWKLLLKRRKIEKESAITIEIEKDISYKIVIIPSIFKGNNELLSNIKNSITADEYIIGSPYEDLDYVNLSMTSIESFRRIQQIILRGMIFSDVKRNDCPFCDHSLAINIEKSQPNRPVYECNSCRTSIEYAYCDKYKKTYSYTRISGLNKANLSGDEWLYKRKREAAMFFRNITKINDALEIICPFCNSIHKD